MRTPDGLTHREREFLRLVSLSQGVIPHEALSMSMYGKASGAVLRRNLANLRVIAHRLREKRPEIGLQTVRGEGYIMRARICPACKGSGLVKRS